MHTYLTVFDDWMGGTDAHVFIKPRDIPVIRYTICVLMVVWVRDCYVGWSVDLYLVLPTTLLLYYTSKSADYLNINNYIYQQLKFQQFL